MCPCRGFGSLDPTLRPRGYASAAERAIERTDNPSGSQALVGTTFTHAMIGRLARSAVSMLAMALFTAFQVSLHVHCSLLISAHRARSFGLCDLPPTALSVDNDIGRDP